MSSWNVVELWQYSDWIERLIFLALALLFAHTAIVLRRGLRYYKLAVDFGSDSASSARFRNASITSLRSAVRTLKQIASAAPFLGLAGTSYGILASFHGIAMEKNAALALLSREIAASLVMAVYGMSAAIPAVVSAGILQTRLDRLLPQLALSRTNEGESARDFTSIQTAQRLPLQKKFSGFPAFALLAAPAIGISAALWISFYPASYPTGLSVWLSSENQTLSHPPVIRLAKASTDGSLVIRLNAERLSLDNLQQSLKVNSPRIAYLQAEDGVVWADVLSVIDAVKSVGSEVILLPRAGVPTNL